MHTKENVKFDVIECKISKPSMSKLIIAHYLARKLFACTTTMPMELNIICWNIYLALDVLHSYKNELHKMLCLVTYNTKF